MLTDCFKHNFHSDDEIECLGCVSEERDRLAARIAELEYLVAVNIDPGECNDKDAELVRSCHRTAFPGNYR